MRLFILFILILILTVSCKTVDPYAVPEIRQDTLEFDFLYAEALKSKMLGYEKKAIQQFLHCLSINKGSAASAYQLSILYLNSEDFTNAIKYADFCLNTNSDNEWYILNRANIARLNSDPDKYLSLYEKLISLFPDNINYTYELAVIYYENKSYNKSLQLLFHIEDIIGVDENISFLKNNINFQLNKYDAIQAELLKLKVFFPDSIKYMDMLAEFYLNSNHPERAFNLYTNILAVDKDNSNAIMGLAYIYAKTNNYRNGLNFLYRALGSPTVDILRKEKISSFYFDAPNDLLADYEIDSIYKLLLTDHSVSIETINDYLEFLYKLKRITNAEQIAKFSIRLRPENFWAWDYLFTILMSQSRFDELNSYAQKALEYFPNHASVYYYSGFTFFMQGKFNEAITFFQTGFDYVIDNRNLEQQFYLYLAESYHSIGKHTKSDDYFEKYLKNDSTNAYLLNNYAYYLSIRNTDLNKAEQLSRKSIEIEPFNPIFLDTYSWIMFMKKEYAKSLNFSQRAYRYGGNKNFVIVEHFGDVLVKLGEYLEALEKYEEALLLNTSNGGLQNKIEQLKSKLK